MAQKETKPTVVMILAFRAIWRRERERQQGLDGSKDSSTYFCVWVGGLTKISTGLLRVLEENP